MKINQLVLRMTGSHSTIKKNLLGLIGLCMCLPMSSQAQTGWPTYTREGEERRYQPEESASGRYSSEMQDAKAAADRIIDRQQQMRQSMAQPPANFGQQASQGYQPQRMPGQYQPPIQRQQHHMQQPPTPPAARQSQMNRFNPDSIQDLRNASNTGYARQSSKNWKFSFGAGLGYLPEFEGGDTYKVRLLPIVDVSYKDTFFLNTSRGAGINVYNQRGFRAGPYLTYNFGRDEGDAAYLAGSGDIKGTFESGVFVEKEFNPFTVLWTARYATFNRGHAGVVSDLELAYYLVGTDKMDASVSLSTSWASENYMTAFFGVDAGHSALSGLNTYTPESGFKDIGIDGSITYALEDNVSLAVSTGMKRFVGQAADSPVVNKGSGAQIFSTTGIIYHF